MLASANGTVVVEESAPTLPSAQSIICCIGRFALYMVVVFHQIGNPRHRTISQKDSMT